MLEQVAVGVLAKAPILGFAKTRLIPVLGAEAAAALQGRLIERAVATACAAATGPVTLWTTPDDSHPVFRRVAASARVATARQVDGDLGARMLAAIAAAGGPALVIGVDCPALAPLHIREAAEILRNGADAVVIPVEDGGYALIGMRRPQAALFGRIRWGESDVMQVTRARLRELGWIWREPVTLWDVDVPADLDRLAQSGLELAGE
jgi:rSAM/selenodomain-associated transferase 1